MPEPLLMIGNFLSGRLHTRGMGEELYQRLQACGWPVITASSRPNRVMRLADMLGTALFRAREYRLALVEVYSGPAFAWAEAVAVLLRWLGKPCVLVLHGGGLPAFAKRYPARVKRLLNHANRVSTPSRYLLEQMSGYRADLVLIPNPLELSRYPFALRISPQPRLLWLRAFHNLYNPSMAIRTLAELVTEYPDAQLTMTGPDKGDGSRQATEKAIEKNNLTRHVTLVGGISKNDVPAALSKGDIFLNTTYVDNTPVSVMEAMACGLCVVSTNVGGMPYLLEDGEDALLVPPDDPGAMAAAVRRILTEPGLAEKLSTNARTKAGQFDWSVILPQWEALLEGMM